ncbi:Minf_1886 family protein [Roseimaritima sediminicola]|uniref:Minf_1886 family protein n=1 Tax=Roseimaritima sediminicola TaxID=2662066 RepID=UPI0012983940|nr:Minf_1886 family protein [Roseimaritima sediminicola]
MSAIHPISELLDRDRRYKLEAYQFIRESLAYAHDVLRLHELPATDSPEARHITGQQLCEACRVYALEQYGYMAKLVLNRWGLHETSDFGEIVYNLIAIEQMKKSDSDRREDFDDVYDFDSAFEPQFTAIAADEV